MKAKSSDKLSELVEINLLFAHMELGRAEFDRSALLRTRQHIEHALKDIRAERRCTLRVANNDAA